MPAIAYRRTTRAGAAGTETALLRNGDQLSQPEFHRRYEAYPDKTKFELIDGVVYMASPMSNDHSENDLEISTITALYKAATPGVRSGANPTVILGEESEPQPDHVLYILPEYGGRTSRQGKYLAGPPEFIAEVAFSSVSIDLHKKRDDYRRAGVAEYVVVCLEDEVVRWFDLTQDHALTIDRDGILRSWMFPGLWIDVAALFDCDTNQLVAMLNEGLATPRHCAFVQKLAARKAELAKPKPGRPGKSRPKRPKRKS